MFKVKYCDLSLMCHIFALTSQTLFEQVLTGLVREPCLTLTMLKPSCLSCW